MFHNIVTLSRALDQLQADDLKTLRSSAISLCPRGEPRLTVMLQSPHVNPYA